MNTEISNILSLDAVIVGSGCAGLNCADELYGLGVKNIAIVTEGLYMGTSINTGSDKQTYYKLSSTGSEQDSVYDMAKTLYSGGCMEGYHALCEASCSSKAFFKLVSIGVDFPKNRYGEYVGYRTDHDYRKRATSCGPLTSKFMAECLIKRIKEKNITVLEDMRAIKVLTKEKKSVGILAVDGEGNLTLIKAKKVVLATGGPSGIYSSSVFPKSQTGSLATALECGASGVNLTEWQYGIASTDFRWNLSGTYMQVIPRFVSKDKDGNIREFLADYLGDMQFGHIFQKGYNWPFSPSKLAGENSSSLVDMAVYSERMRGNEVFLDYMHEPSEFVMSKLPEEAYDYLKNSEVTELDTPIKRLRHMNERAYQLYLSGGIDLERELLRIDVCAQHCNGGIACDENYMSKEIDSLYVCGECSGTFGIARPGGTALNNTQVSSMRASEHIADNLQSEIISDEEATSLITDKAELCEALSKGTKTASELLSYRKEIGSLMSAKCSFVRSSKNADFALSELYKMKKSFIADNGTTRNLLKEALINYDLLVSAIAIAYAQKIYCDDGKKSRGSFLVTDSESIDFAEIKCETDNTTLYNITLSDTPSYTKSIVSPIPDSEQWFERVYNEYYAK
ncbi:MAG: FAD-binding protein [Clostridia bacterium]|nr:FAD-binding protein [Clostridia bacterium]